MELPGCRRRNPDHGGHGLRASRPNLSTSALPQAPDLAPQLDQVATGNAEPLVEDGLLTKARNAMMEEGPGEING